MRTNVMAALAALVVVSVSSLGCGEAQVLACSPETCRGCCDAAKVCQPGTTGDACGAGGFACNVCSAGASCQAFGQCLPQAQPPQGDAGFDAGLTPDAGLEVDAGAPAVDAGLDAGSGVDCGGSWVTNPGFECGLLGWRVLEGQGRSSAGGVWQGTQALELIADDRGFARVAAAEPIAVSATSTLCVAVTARGSVPNVRLEVLVTPSNLGTSFSAPVTATWTRVPPSMLAVPVPAGSEAWLMVRASGASAGQVLALDDVEVRFSASASCP